ncbi:hypothetical protein PXJ20_03955 [Paraburkholderia sp. A1RI_3L]|uniref:hypothetical protein n=1 Tax=Paraburkholderia TaxID=1822464 RepID=UPI0018F3BD08|nr:hypothetical protein [Paraburkholderia kururiensis]
MEIVFVGKKLEDAGLVHPKLNALQADDGLYTVLTVQPRGRIRIADNSIGHVDSADAKCQMRGLFECVAAMESQPDLVIAPEYSVPWDALLESLEAGLKPQPGKLWVLGCESLPLGCLDRHRERLGDKAVILDDDISPKPRTTQQYRNPLVYVFLTGSGDDASDRLVLLVQYKTEPSGDPGNTEATGMLPGQNVYLFGRAPEEVRLMTLICSDVFGFKDDLISRHYDGLLLLHVQLNNSPRHLTYKKYRQELFAYGGRTELICLNWAEKITSVDQNGQNEHEWNNIGGSAWYLLPAEFDVSDARIMENHVHGVYYTRHEPIRVHALQFDYQPRVFLFQTTKVFHHAILKPRSTRSGPKVLKTLFWSADAGAWSEPTRPEERPNDGFEALLAGASGGGVDLEDVRALYREGPVSVERAMAIAAGEIGPKENWYLAPRIDSMMLCEQEIVRRVTVTQDPAPEAVKFRSERLGSIRAIAELRGSAYEWPAGVEALRSGFRFAWSQKYPGRNVVATDGTLATVVHVALVGDMAQMERLDQRVRKTLAGPPPEPERLLSAEQELTFRRQHYATKAERLCILYSTATGSKPYVSVRSSSFTSPAGQSPVDIGVPSFSRIVGEQPGAQP